MKSIKKILFAIATATVLFGCEEAQRFEISGDDSTPPAAPVFIKSTPLPGGARVFYQRPSDEDLLAIEAAYTNTAGEQVWFSASYFTDSLDVLGFPSEGEHVINLYAVDRAGNRSITLPETVTAHEPPVVAVAKSVRVLPSFTSMILRWEDLLKQSVYVFVDIAYTQSGAQQKSTTVFNTINSESIVIDSLKLYNKEPVSVKITVKDKYGNVAQSKDTTVVLLVDEQLPKDGWKLLPAGTVMGGVTQADGNANGGNMNTVIDGLTEADKVNNFYYTASANPWNIIIDLGKEYRLSRIRTFQRHSYTDESTRGAFYRGQNVMAYNMYIWDEATGAWELVSRHDITVPVVKQETDWLKLGYAGDPAFLYPEQPDFSKPTRYFRFQAIRGRYISEISLYGKAD